MTTTRHYIRVNSNSFNGQLHMRTAGDSSLPALLLLHQAPSHSGMFEPLMRLLTDSFFCVAPDYPGCGMSDAAQDWQIETIASTIGCLLDSQNITPAVVFGHHTGASVAAQLNAFHDLGQHLVLSGPPLLSSEQKTKLSASAPAFTVDKQGRYLASAWAYIRGKDHLVDLQLSQRELLSSLQLGDGYRALYQAVAQHDFAACLEQIKAPTTVFAGQRDVLRFAVTPTVEALANGKAVEIGDSSTYVCETHANEVADIIRRCHFQKG